MVDRISSTDRAYQTGDLSVFPEALDDRDMLYEATNNATIVLKQTVSYTSKIIIVEDTSLFPDKGILRIGPPPGESGQFEMVYYETKTSNTFQDLIRSFASSKRGTWKAGQHYVSNVVHAQHHNSVKDAIINLETNIGLKENPDEFSLNGILKAQEDRFLAPKPCFRAFPIVGPAPLKVRFQNFTTGHIIRNLWDFGDGGTSLEESPIHTYLVEGTYTVKLNVVTSTGAQGVATKTEYIVVDNDESIPFFYVDSISDPYSRTTAEELTGQGTPTDAKEFVFVDQSDGEIVQRNWVFGDGTKYTEEDPDVHQSIPHIYEEPGEYIVTCLISFSNGRLKRVELPEPLTVL
jgi:PKD repeat protein